MPLFLILLLDYMVQYIEEKHWKIAKGLEFAARIVSGKMKFDHLTPSLRQLNWLPLSYMLRFSDTVIAFRCIRCMAPSYLCRMFERRSRVHNLNARSSGELDLPLYKTTTCRTTFVQLPCCSHLEQFVRVVNKLTTIQVWTKRFIVPRVYLKPEISVALKLLDLFTLYFT